MGESVTHHIKTYDVPQTGEVVLIPHVPKHDREMTQFGTGSFNGREYCKCEYCTALRKRRDAIYSGPCQKINRFLNKL